MYFYFFYFLIFAFLGWVVEVIFAAITQRRFVNRGFLYGPFCPIYGFGIVLAEVILSPISENIWILVVATLLLTSLLEYFSGFFLEKIFHKKWWDYSKTPHNLSGYICLKFSVIWGLVGSLIIKTAIPFFHNIIEKIPYNFGISIICVLTLMLLVDFIITSISVASLSNIVRKQKVLFGKIRSESGLISAKTVDLREKYKKYFSKSRIYKRLQIAFANLSDIHTNEHFEIITSGFYKLEEKKSIQMQKREAAAFDAYETKLPKGKEAPFGNGFCLTKMFYVFMIGNIIGYLLETVWCIIMFHKFEFRGSLVFGPFNLVYGFGAVAISLCLWKLYKQKEVLIFFASMFIGGVFEYLCSFFQQLAFGTVSWEYSASPFSIGGRTDVIYMLFWGILGVIWVRDLYPIMSRLIEKIPKKLGYKLTIILFIFMLINSLISIGAVVRQSQRVAEIPANDIVARFFDKYFNDTVLNKIYPNMKYVGRPDVTDELLR